MKTVALPTLGAILAALLLPGTAHADNRRINDGVMANIYTIQHQAGCDIDLQINPQLRQAAQWHVADLMINRNLLGGIGSDGSLPADRAHAAAYRGTVAETVA